MLVTRAGFGLERAMVERLDGEQAEFVAAIVRQELLVALDGEVAVDILNTEAAAPAAAVRLHCLEPAFPAIVVKGGGDVAAVLDLELAIIGVAGAEADRIDKTAAGVDFGARIFAHLLDVDRRRFGLDCRVERIADRHAVAIIVAADRNAGIVATVDPGDPAGKFRGLDRRVGESIAKVSEGPYLRIRAGRCLFPE